MKPQVFVSSYYDRATIDAELSRLEPAARVLHSEAGRRLTRGEIIYKMAEAEIAVISDEVFSDEVFRALPALQLLLVDGVGVDSIDLAAATAHGVIVNNAPFVHEANGEFTLGLILAVTRRIVAADRAVREGRWNERNRYIGTGLKGMTLGLLGFGRAARNVALRASSFGLRIIAYSPNADAAVARELGVTLVSYQTLLADSDILSLHVTLTPQTRGMIDAAAFSKMKQGAYLINTSRGAVVDEGALIAALSTGRLRGAGIDVFAHEPPAVDNPLFKMDNVVVTAHIASDSLDAFRAVFRGAVDDILLFLSGEQPAHVVNPAVLGRPKMVSAPLNKRTEIAKAL